MSVPQAITAENAPRAVGPYSHAAQAAGLVFVSGQLGLHPATGELQDTFELQARQALANLAAVLDAAGRSIHHIASVDVFLTDMERFKEFNAIYAEFMGDHHPARAAFGVAALPLGGMVEVRCIATAG
jgi:2-iminobutanoate/2-iminopropanoate deaminase